MQEVFEKIKQKLLSESTGGVMCPPFVLLERAIEIVDEVEEEYAKVSVEGDLISRNALLEDLRKCEEKCEGALILPSWLYACRIIKNQPSIQNNKWIPCSERLPEKDDYYLITTSDGEIDVRKYDYGTRWGWNGFERIIAWQPLPEPYKKEVRYGNQRFSNRKGF